jgi:predicted transcriptional regulator of viral defense system
MNDELTGRYQAAEQIFREHDGLLRTSQALDLGIAPPTLYEMRDRGLLIRESLGLYRLASTEPLNYPDLVTIAMKVPKAVIALTTALAYYGLTIQIPSRVWFALPRGIKKPKIEHPPIAVVHMSPRSYQAGMITIQLDGKDVQIYSPEKTVADCFKFRGRIGEEIAIEALKDYLGQQDFKINELMEYAKINRVDKIMLPYLKSETI